MARRKSLTWDDKEISNRILKAPAAADRALVAIMKYHAPKATRYMKQHAPWSDRTSNARNGLFSQAFADRPRYGIVLAHRVTYGIWLEVKWSGRYAIIMPTVNHEGPEVMRTCSLLFATIFKGV